jgi:Uma2 family endonuclease
MQAARPRMNYHQLRRLPDDGRRYELHDGVLSEVPSPRPRHQRVVQHVQEVLLAYERSAGGLVLVSPMDVVLSAHDVVQPDVMFLTREQADGLDLDAPIRLPPALCVEVLSASTEAVDRGWKLRMLARFGVGEYWLVDTEDGTIERYTRDAVDADRFVLDAVVSADDTMTSRALADLQFPARAVFEK